MESAVAIKAGPRCTIAFGLLGTIGPASWLIYFTWQSRAMDATPRRLQASTTSSATPDDPLMTI
jgi:hypothetical protein